MDQIRSALELIRDDLDRFLQNLDARAEPWVVLSNIVDRDGRSVQSTRDKLVMLLANIRHEATLRTAPGSNRPGRSLGVIQAPLNLDLAILFFANFSDDAYAEGLAAIGRTINFFHQNPVFTRDNTADLDPLIDKLMLEPTDLDLHELHDLMEMLGAKYLPCVCYKLRMTLPVNDAIQSRVPVAGV